MVVLPPLLNLRWGTHPPLLGPFLVMAPILLALAPSVSAVTSLCATSRGHSDLNAKFLYINNQETPITLMTSRRIPHRLLTEVVAIFLRQHLGYANVILTYHDGFFPDDVHKGMGIGFDLYSSVSVNFTPRALINLEMWTPPGYWASEYSALTTDIYLGVVGRLGWFFPYYVIDKYHLIDHWRAFTQQNSEAVRVFSRTLQELERSEGSRLDPTSGEFYCSAPICHKGVFTPTICENRNCAVLYAAYYNESSFLADHIRNMSLYVRVAWLGPNLNTEFIRENLEFSDRRSVLFFHYTPDVLIQPFNLTSVAFPPCANNIEYSGVNKSIFCMYEMHRFNKVIWSRLKNEDSFLYKFFDRVAISVNDYENLIKEFNKDPTKPLSEIACSWMDKNKDVWGMWHNGNPKTDLYLVGLFPITNIVDNQKFQTLGNIPAFNMAIKAVNANNSILPDHQVKQFIIDTACEADYVMVRFIEILHHSIKRSKYTKIVGILGPACSDTIEPIAGVSKHFRIPIISYGAEGLFPPERPEYSYLFRTIPENGIFKTVYLQLFKKLNWRRAVSLTKDGHHFSEYLTPLHDLLRNNGVKLNSLKFPQEMKTVNLTQTLSDLKNQNYRIIIMEFYQDVARFVLCEAFHQQMTGQQGYVWFLPFWYPKDWYDVDQWNSNSSFPVPCNTSEMVRALQGHMSMSYKYFADDDSIAPEGETVAQWKDRYRKQTEKQHIKASDYAGFTYDAVYTYALALDKLFREDHSFTSNLRSKETTERFVHHINATHFSGVSGHINFTSGPSRMTDILVWQFTNRSYAQVGRFYPNGSKDEQGRLDLDINRLVWQTKSIPKDGSKECIVERLRLLMGDDVTCNTAIVSLCTFSFLSLAVILLFVMLFLKRRYVAKLRMMEELWHRDHDIFKKLIGWEIPKSKVVSNRKLGEGQFGMVYGGECFVEHSGWLAVAVKTLKIGSTTEEKLDFLYEAEMMKNFDHENIVKLIGVVTESEPLFIIMEFMLYGDLRTYLLGRRHMVNEVKRNEGDEVSNGHLTAMALDVARALAYLADLKFVHRDVACRNCLVNAYRSVKLADFGMTRHLNEKNYYRLSRKVMLPVRWMAPESAVDGVFTTSSDIWSYGILLYEIITFGARPFEGLSNDQVIGILKRAKSGETLLFSGKICHELECLLQSCCHPVPEKRSTAEQIATHLEKSPRLISPCLDIPQPSLPLDTSAGLEFRIHDSRKLSLSLNSRAMLTQGAGIGVEVTAVVGGASSDVTASRRKRSMSGNMVMTLKPSLAPSMSVDGIHLASNMDSMSLNQAIDDGVRDMGKDPLLPNSQYISRYISPSHRVERSGIKDTYGVTRIHKDMWTNITPV